MVAMTGVSSIGTSIYYEGEYLEVKLTCDPETAPTHRRHFLEGLVELLPILALSTPETGGKQVRRRVGAGLILELIADFAFIPPKEVLVYRFLTAWSALSNKVMRSMSKMFPDLKVKPTVGEQGEGFVVSKIMFVWY